MTLLPTSDAVPRIAIAMGLTGVSRLPSVRKRSRSFTRLDKVGGEISIGAEMQMRVAREAILIRIAFAGFHCVSRRSGICAPNTRSVPRISSQLRIMKLVPSCLSAGEKTDSFKHDFAVTEHP